MNKLVKGISALTVAAALSLPSATFAQTNVGAKYLLDADVKVNGTTIEVNAGLRGGALIDSSLLSGGEWQIVDQNGKILHAQKSSKLKLNAKIENLQPSVEYCLDLRVKGKVADELINANLRANADQQIQLNKQGLKVKNGFLCVTTGKPNDPNTPPATPTDPKAPKQVNTPKQDETPKSNEAPKNDETPKTLPGKIEEPSLIDRLLNLFK